MHDGAARDATRPVVTEPVRKGSVSPRLPVPSTIRRPDYADRGRPRGFHASRPFTSSELLRMRRACRAAALVLDEISKLAGPGITTDTIDRAAHAAYLRLGGYPSTLNYHGFPKSLCTSVNEVVCHGIPDDRALRDGDIVNLDVTIYLDGMHGDCSATYPVGDIDPGSAHLVQVTRECLELGIAAVRPGRPFRAIGQAIEPHAARHGYNVVRRYGGHGIGRSFHTELHVPHHDDPRATRIIEPGMVFTIEPMLTAGTFTVREWDDGWTVVTADGKRSAQFEHTILVTDHGAEILTTI